MSDALGSAQTDAALVAPMQVRKAVVLGTNIVFSNLTISSVGPTALDAPFASALQLVLNADSATITDRLDANVGVQRIETPKLKPKSKSDPPPMSLPQHNDQIAQRIGLSLDPTAKDQSKSASNDIYMITDGLLVAPISPASQQVPVTLRNMVPDNPQVSQAIQHDAMMGKHLQMTVATIGESTPASAETCLPTQTPGVNIEDKLGLADSSSNVFPDIGATGPTGKLDKRSATVSPASFNAEAGRRPIADQLEPVLIHLSAADAGRKMSLQLAPRELGQVHIEIVQSKEGTTTISLSTDRPETMILLQHDHDSLSKMLDRLGVSPEGRVINYQIIEPPSLSATTMYPLVGRSDWKDGNSLSLTDYGSSNFSGGEDRAAKQWRFGTEGMSLTNSGSCDEGLANDGAATSRPILRTMIAGLNITA